MLVKDKRECFVRRFSCLESLRMYVGADGFAVDNAFQVAKLVHVENVNRQVVFLAHSYGGDVHHAQSALEHFVVVMIEHWVRCASSLWFLRLII